MQKLNQILAILLLSERVFDYLMPDPHKLRLCCRTLTSLAAA